MFSLILLVAVPILFVGSIVAAVQRKWKIGIVLLALALAGNWYSRLYAFGFTSGESDVKVMTFNVHCSADDITAKSEEVMHIISTESPDFLFLPELGTAVKKCMSA